MLREGACDMPGCNRRGFVIAKVIPSIGKICYVCNGERLKKDKPPKQAYTPKKRPTGEKELFGEIWNERPHYSFVSNTFLGNDGRSFYFAHVLPKSENSRWPKFKLYAPNIVLLTWEEHDAWDKGDREKLKLDPRWDKMFALEEELKQLYTQLYGTAQT